MVEDEYVSIQEAARRCGVSGKTIQRAIQAGKLPAQYPKPNQCKIAISALETFRPRQVSGHAPNPADLESRIAVLEYRLTEMERLVEQLQRERQGVQLETTRKADTTKPRASRPRPPTQSMPLPEGLVLLQAFISLHAVSSNEAEKRWKAGFIHVVKQLETGGKRRQTIALDEQGRHDFWVQFHTTNGFRSCDQCPHSVPGQMPGQ
jgi:excisionase family DNA binding protein